jgi:hypothetical protein
MAGLPVLFPCVEPPLNEPREIAVVSLLDLRFSPVGAGDRPAAILAAAAARHFVRLVVGHGVVEGQLFARGYVSHRYENDLALQPQIRLA